MSKRIRVIFYKAKFGDGHWIDNLISSWTWLISSKNKKVGPYSHVEIWTPQSTGLFKRSDGSEYDGQSRTIQYKTVGTCWTSTTRGENNGTVSRPANKVISNRERWSFCEIEIKEVDYARMLRWMEREVRANNGYSKRDLLKFFGLGFFADNLKNICSEFSLNALHQALVLREKGVVSPRRLAWKLQKAGYQIKELK